MNETNRLASCKVPPEQYQGISYIIRSIARLDPLFLPNIQFVDSPDTVLMCRLRYIFHTYGTLRLVLRDFCKCMYESLTLETDEALQ